MKRSTWWPIGVAAILATTVAANAALYYVANDDPSVAIEPDYYRKAVDWDITMAQEAHNVTLGWRLAPALDPYTARDGARLHVSLRDSAGGFIPGARIRVSALYLARANTIYDTLLAESGGEYSGHLPVHHRGQWELRFDVTRGDDHFTARTRVEALSASQDP